MRWFLALVLFLPGLAAGGPTDYEKDRMLCHAAVMESALPEAVDTLLESGQFQFDDVGDILALDCDGRTLLRAMLEERQAENLEYAVIDLGLPLDAPLALPEGDTTLIDWLGRVAEDHDDAAVRTFARAYLRRFQDESFNPNLLVSAR